MQAAGKRTLVLKRLRVGPLHLGSLGTGAFRELDDAEVQALYAAASPRPRPPS
jgi:16S rRNA U516 pseudouridylate synthase RsuA-like enzyme